MNKTLIALAVSAAAVATGAYADGINQSGDKAGSTVYSAKGTSLEVGGRAEARLSLKDGKAQDNSRVRLNFLGKAEINDSLYGVGFYEGEFTTNDQGKNASNNSLDNRYTYAGIGGTYGEVTYGKNDGALGVITDFTDIMSYHGNTAAEKIAVADRVDNMLAYKGQFGDLGVKASYRFADRNAVNAVDAMGNVVTETNAAKYSDNGEDGYSLSAIYTFGDTGFNVGAGYADQDDQNEYMLAASYRMENLYFAGLFTDGELAKDVDYTGYELAAGYKLGQAAFTATYNNAETAKETSADNFAIDATYYFKPNFRSYISYQFNLLDSDKFGKVASEDELAIGLRYDF